MSYPPNETRVLIIRQSLGGVPSIVEIAQLLKWYSLTDQTHWEFRTDNGESFSVKHLAAWMPLPKFSDERWTMCNK